MHFFFCLGVMVMTSEKSTTLVKQSIDDDDVEQNMNSGQADTFYADNVLTKTGFIAIRSLQQCSALCEIAAPLTMVEVRKNSVGKEMAPKTIGNKRPDIKNQGIHMYNQLEKYVLRVKPSVSVLTNRSL